MPDRKSEPEGYGETEPKLDRDDIYSNAPRLDEDDEPTQKVTPQKSGAKRDSYFKKRDY